MPHTPDNLLVGTRGWDHASWQGGFYPQELPPDWRLGFYATQMRCVLVPADLCARASRSQGARWMQDTGEPFRFLLEVDLADWRDPAAFLAATEALAGRTAAVLVRTPPPGADPSPWVAALAARAPVCLDAPLPGGASGASRCWRPARDPAPDPAGSFLLAIAPPADLRTARGWLERMGEWCGRDRGAALIVDDGPDAPVFAHQLRLAAELMGL